MTEVPGVCEWVPLDLRVRGRMLSIPLAPGAVSMGHTNA